MTNPLLDLPSSTLASLKDGLRMGFIRSPYEAAGLRGSIGAASSLEALEGLEALRRLGIVDQGVVAWLDAVEEARAEVPRPSLVWTGPRVTGLQARNTREVFEELILRAESSLWISTFAYFDGKRAFEVLAQRMDAVSGLQVRVLLNIHQGESFADAAETVRAARRRLWKHNWPGERRPDVYYFPESLAADSQERAVLHAKAIVRDEHEILITSANFTEAALERNIELGVVLNDAPFALTVVRHFQRLIEEGRLLPIGDDAGAE